MCLAISRPRRGADVHEKLEDDSLNVGVAHAQPGQRVGHDGKESICRTGHDIFEEEAC